MKFEIARRDLLRPIQLVTGVVEKRQTLPILSNVRIGVKGDDLTVSGTDLEIELVARVKLATPAAEDGETTVPARKLADLWRSLPEDAVVTVSAEGERATIRSGRTKFLLATKSADEYPSLDSTDDAPEIFVPRTEVAGLIARTGFSMAQQDVRYFLNGLLLELGDGLLRAVATDGHRLATATTGVAASPSTKLQAIVPRKAVQEIARLLTEGDDEVSIRIGSSSLQLATSSFRLSTKLIDGRFPDYEKVIPPRGSREIIGGRDALRQAFGRAAILSNEKYRGVRLTIGEGSLTVHANNPEQEEAEEVVELETSGEPIEISFNVSYLQDALGAMQGDMVRLSLTDANSSARLEAPGDDSATYVVMPMRL
jgi:DNA polymerase-3 subunit beta